MIKASGKNLDDWIRRLFPLLFRWKIDPNTLTVAGALVSTTAAAAFAASAPRAAGLLILAGGFFDLVDGVVARQRGIATRFGAFLDSTLDRWADVVLLVGISVHYAREGAPQYVALAGFALAATVLVSYTKARAQLELAQFEIGLMERAERVLILAAGALFGLLVAALWIIAIGSAITAGQRIALAYREMSRLDAAEAKLEPPR